MYIVCWVDRVDGRFIDRWETYDDKHDAQKTYDFLVNENENLWTASICKPIQSTDYFNVQVTA
jgi:hypothetical protein